MVRWLRDGPLREWACTTYTSQVLELLLLIPGLLAIERLFGSHLYWGPALAGAVGGSFGLLMRARSGPRGYREASKPDRRRVRGVQFSGRSSGDEFLDWVAVQRQRQLAKGDNPATVALYAVLLLGFAAGPIAVVIRGAGPWWLAAEVALSAAGLIALLQYWFPSPRARLEILIDNLAVVRS